MSVHRPAFICRFEEPSCWDRPEPRRRRAKWKLILVWVPEMSAAPVIPASTLQLLSTVITVSGRSSADSRNFHSQWLVNGDLKGPGVPYHHPGCYYYGLLFAFTEALIADFCAA